MLDPVSGSTTGKDTNGLPVVRDVPRQGWECPKCGRVHAPFVSTCPYCVGDNPWRPYAPQPYYPSLPYPNTAPYWGPMQWYNNCEPRTR